MSDTKTITLKIDPEIMEHWIGLGLHEAGYLTATDIIVGVDLGLEVDDLGNYEIDVEVLV